MRTVRDAVHGDLEFDDAEMALVDAPTFQRLRGIRQLGTASLVFPCATHARFDHALGTCHLAKRMLAELERAGERIDAEERRAAALFALLHDVTHVPFGHTLEDERRLLPRHDEDPARLAYFLGRPDIDRALRASGVGDRVRAAMAGQGGGLPWRLVAGTVGADLLDYLRRDAFFCGLELDYDDRLFQCLGLADGQVVVRLHKNGEPRRDALSELVHLLQLRYALTERVYFHHAKNVAGTMVARAVELAMDAGLVAAEDLYSLRDERLIERLHRAAAAVTGLADLLDDIDGRRLYRRAFQLHAAGFGHPGVGPDRQAALAGRYRDDVAGRKAAEARLAERLGAPEAHVAIFCAAPLVQAKGTDIPVELRPGVVRPLGGVGHPDVAGLRAKHAALWRLVVCVRRDHDARRRVVAEWCAEEFGAIGGGGLDASP